MATKPKSKQAKKSTHSHSKRASKKTSATKKIASPSSTSAKPSAAKDRMVRLLMTLSECEGETVKRGDVTKRLPRRSKQESTKTYAKTMGELGKAGALSEEKGMLTLDKEMVRDRLLVELTQPGFTFQGPLGMGKANVLLEMIKELVITPSSGTNGNSNSNGNVKMLEPIASYDDFKTIVLETTQRLSREYNLDNLVPIYRVRQELGDRVGRLQFNDWMFEIQAEDIIQLTGGDLSNASKEQKEDSVTIPGGGLRFYIQML